MSIIDNVEGWIVGKAIVRAIASAAKLIVSFAVAHGIALVTTIHGIPINIQDQGAMTLALNSGLKVLEDYLQNKYPGKFLWL